MVRFYESLRGTSAREAHKLNGLMRVYAANGELKRVVDTHPTSGYEVKPQQKRMEITEPIALE